MGPRILHVWNTAGVASIIARSVDREYGTVSTVMARKAADRTGLTTYGTTYADGPARFFARALLKSRSSDLVHVHSLDRIVPWLKRVGPRRPAVINYHGTDIEGRWEDKEDRWKRADAVVCSTTNLLVGAPPSAVHIPNPVDTGLFRPAGGRPPPGSAITFRYGADAEAEASARKLGLTLTTLERGSVPHVRMPDILSKSEYYIDVKRGNSGSILQALSLTALEALACGCKVVDWEGMVRQGLPTENEPRAVAERWHELYTRLLESNS